jgi:hypothetical protein
VTVNADWKSSNIGKGWEMHSVEQELACFRSVIGSKGDSSNIKTYR